MLGIPSLENKKDVLVSWCLGFLVVGRWCSVFGFVVFGLLVYWFLGFLVSWLFGLLVYWFQKQLSISCSLEAIGPISKIFEILLNGCSSLFGARLFQNDQKRNTRL